MSAPTLDPLLKEIIQACTDLPRARPEERRAFWQALGDWQTRLDQLALIMRVGGSVQPMGGMGARMPDPQQQNRPQEACHALMALHFGLPDLRGPRTPPEQFRADLDHLSLRIQSSEVLNVDSSTRQRLELAKARLVTVRGNVPLDAQLALLAVIIRCYRAIQEDNVRKTD